MGTAVRRHPLIVLLAVVICMGAAAAAGLARKPTYTATAKLQIGGINLNQPGALAGLLTAEETLAASYSRAATSNAVVTQVKNELHIKYGTVLADISSTPVPDSGNFTISATSKNSGFARTLANDTASALVSWITTLNQSTADARRLYGEVKKASSALAKANTAALEAGAALTRAKDHPTAAELKAYSDTHATVDALSTSIQALRNAYVSALSSQASTDTAQLVAPATQTSSDRLTKLEILLGGGLVVGLLIGTALAVLRSRRRARRIPPVPVVEG